MIVPSRTAVSPVTPAMQRDMREADAAGLAALNALGSAEAESALLRCCGSMRWARLMAAMRPFATVQALIEVGGDVWDALLPDDWLQAFAAHPRIGARVDAGASATAAWSAGEQSGVEAARDDDRAELARLNEAYEEKFGHIFIVCATGLSAGEILDQCRERLHNEPEQELLNAAREQTKITEIRLRKLLTELGESR